MACSINLNQGISGEDTGGVFIYHGFNTVAQPSGTTGSYTNTSLSPFTAIQGTTPITNPVSGATANYATNINFDTKPKGYYHFTYVVGSSPCQTSTFFTIYVADQPEAGSDTTITTCPVATTVYNLFSLLGTTPSPLTTGVWTYAGSATSALTTGTSPNLSFAPNGLAAGTYEFIYTVTANIPAGYTVDPACTDCALNTNKITFVITANPNPGTPSNIAVCN